MKHIFWHVILPIALLAGANAFDWKTTSDSVHRGNIENNSAWLIGKRPSNLKIAIGGAATFSFESIVYLRGEQSKKLKWPARSWTAYEFEHHVQLGVHNASLPRIHRDEAQ